MRFILFILSLSISVISLAGTEHANNNIQIANISDQNSPTEMQNKTNIIKLMQWMNAAMTDPTLINQTAIEHFFKPNIQYRVNGKIYAEDTKMLTQRFKTLVKLQQSGKIALPMSHIALAGNNVAINYQFVVKNNHNISRTDDITALIQFKNGKISSWQSVAASVNIK